VQAWGFLLAALALLAWRPAAAHYRAAQLLVRFSSPSGAAADNVEETTLTLADGTPARIYTPRDRPDAPGVVLVHGVHHTGIDEPRLMRFARAISAAGVVVMTPEMAELRDYRVDPRTIERIGVALAAMRARTGRASGVMGLSFGGGLSLLAAVDPRYAHDVAFVVAVGAHDDLRRVSRFFAMNDIAAPDNVPRPMHAHEYGPTVLVYGHVEDFFPPEDVPTAREALRLWLWEQRDAARAKAASLSPAARAKVELLFDAKIATIAPEILSEIDKNGPLMAQVSPHGRLGGIRVPVYLLHGAGDSVIPATETLWLADDTPPRWRCDVLISPAVVHVELEGEPSARDKLALVHFMADVLAEADAAR